MSGMEDVNLRLIDAAFGHNTTEILSLLEKKADVNTRDPKNPDLGKGRRYGFRLTP